MREMIIEAPHYDKWIAEFAFPIIFSFPIPDNVHAGKHLIISSSN